VSKGSSWKKEEARVTSEVARRAIRRLDFLEWVILAAALGLALGGGALVAWVLTGTSSGAFRRTWMIVSALLFIVPGVIVFVRNKRDQRKSSESPKSKKSDDG
jgi:uncharacterized membrane protein YhaH (DUF805 family)